MPSTRRLAASKMPRTRLSAPDATFPTAPATLAPADLMRSHSPGSASRCALVSCCAAWAWVWASFIVRSASARVWPASASIWPCWELMTPAFSRSHPECSSRTSASAAVAAARCWDVESASAPVIDCWALALAVAT